MEEKINKIYKLIQSMEIDDETLPILEKAMNSFCSNWDKCEGFKKAILLTLDDQTQNHIEDLTHEELDKLLEILK